MSGFDSEKYKEKVKKQHKIIEKMNYILHIGHVRHLELCKNCHSTLGRKKIKEILLEKIDRKVKSYEKIICKMSNLEKDDNNE